LPVSGSTRRPAPSATTSTSPGQPGGRDRQGRFGAPQEFAAAEGAGQVVLFDGRSPVDPEIATSRIASTPEPSSNATIVEPVQAAR
jgi:hypothetical protein